MFNFAQIIPIRWGIIFIFQYVIFFLFFIFLSNSLNIIFVGNVKINIKRCNKKVLW